jgi:hypothetical protein
MKQRLLLITLSIIGFAGVALSVLWLIPSILFSPSGTRAWKIIVAYDMLANSATGGDNGETVSARAYKASLSGNRYGCYLCKLLDWLQPNHCENSAK